MTTSGEYVISSRDNQDVVLRPDGVGQVVAEGTLVTGGTSTGQSQIESGLVVNESSGNSSADSFRAESGSNENALVVDAANDKVTLGVVLQLPVLGAAPAGLTDGMIWAETDGIHVYVNGAEYTLDMTAVP